jgi:hypothetical protein
MAGDFITSHYYIIAIKQHIIFFLIIPDNITPSGPSPIFGGLIMAGAAAKTSNCK